MGIVLEKNQVRANNFFHNKVRGVWHVFHRIEGRRIVRKRSCPAIIISYCQYSSSVQFSSLTQSCLTLPPHWPQQSRPPCPSPNPGVYPNSCPLSQWCHPTISSSVIPFSSCLQSFPASGSFPMSQLFTSSRQNIGVSASASVLPMNIQDRFPLGWTC